MADPREYLNHIWAIFRRQGITDDLTIIEYIAALLLQRWGEEKFPGAGYWPDDSKLQPRVPDLSRDYERELNETLSAAIEAVEDAATLFDKHVIFRLPQMIAGGRYPTPRHIAQTMARLARIQPGASLADFACGTGGLLVAAVETNPYVTGVEISPNMARIARVNAELHNLKGPEHPLREQLSYVTQPRFFGETPPDIYVGNAFETVGKLPEKVIFDCILINPPFGERIDPNLTYRLHFPVDKGRSETLFTFLALSRLKPEGRLATLLPTGSLFSTSSGELTLRNILLEDNQLEAVITLPTDAFQPYSTLPTHLLIVRKPEPYEDKADRKVWFYRVQHDGFSSGRNRQPEPEYNELPRVETAVLAQTEPPILIESENGIGVRVLHLPDDSVCGYCFEQMDEAKSNFTLAQLKHHQNRLSGLLVTGQDPEPTTPIYISGKMLFGRVEVNKFSLDFKRSSELSLNCTFVDEVLSGFSLTMNANSGQIDEGQTRRATINTRDGEPGNLAVIVDSTGNPLFNPLVLDSLDWLKIDRPCALDLQTEEAFAGQLLLFDDPMIESWHMNSLEGEKFRLLKLSTDDYLLVTLSNIADIPPFHFLTMTAAEKFVSTARWAGITVDTEGNWFGVSVGVEEILKDPDLDLQPSSYFPREEPARTLESPAELLANIKQNQQELEKRINFLLGITEMKSVTGSTLPFPVTGDTAPFGQLNAVQQEVWQRIQTFTDEAESPEGQAYPTPRPFRVEDINEQFLPIDVQHAVDLFERMGLVVQISLAGAPYYRQVSEQDIISLDQEQ